MPGCSAVGCSNSTAKKKDEVSLHRYPSDRERCKQWAIQVNRLDAAGKLWMPTQHSRLCSAHFTKDCFVNKDGCKPILIANAVPTLFEHKMTVRPRKLNSLSASRSCLSAVEHLEHRGTSFDHSYMSAENTAVSQSELDVGDVQEEVREKDDASAKKLQEELCQMRYMFEKQKQQNALLLDGISKVFNEDQLSALQRKGAQGMYWGEETIKKALQLKFSCGKSGYELLLEQGMPLPSIKTLQRRMKGISFESGVLPRIFEMLKIKVGRMKDTDRYCSLTLDEMSIEAKTEYDASSGQVLGCVTLPEHTGLATHGLVFMLSGICSRWKQTVAFYFSGNSTNGAIFHDIVLDIIQRAHDAGLFVCNVTSDMGAANRAMWSRFGINAGRNVALQPAIPHPLNSERKLYFMADVPHLLKNLKAALCRTNFICQEKVISISPVEALALHDASQELKIAPKLKISDVKSNHFDKMKVSGAAHVFSNSVSAGITFMINNNLLSDDLKQKGRDTAWFISLVNRWFDLMSSRHPGLALSKFNKQSYDNAIEFLNSFIDTISSLSIGSSWKPVQTGIILSTKTVIHLSEDVLENGVSFLLTARLTQDCLENLFSTIRLKSAVPSPVEFRNSLKIVTVAQFLKTPSNSSYHIDESLYLGNYLEKLPQNEIEMVQEVCVLDATSVHNLDISDVNCLYYITGWSLKVVNSDCADCINATVSATPLTSLKVCSQLTIAKEYCKDALKHPSAQVFAMLEIVEQTFRVWQSAISEVKNTKDFILSKVLPKIDNFDFPTCHNIKLKLLNKYLNLRIHIACSAMSLSSADNSQGYLGSKSMAMRKVVKKIK